MARVGLIDVDGHNFPNLALMRISAYHKSIGDTVEWWWTDFIHYDVVYKSKVFSDTYTKDIEDPMNCDEIIMGGTGYAISTTNGVEVYDKSKDEELPSCIEKMRPDYSIYQQYDFCISMTSRGCPRGCNFCHVGAKEGRCSRKVADVEDFWCGQKKISVLDPNIMACRDKRDLMKQYRDTGALIDFNQGLDIRLIDEADIDDLNMMRIHRLHFAWDNPKDDLEGKFKWFSDKFRLKSHEKKEVYVLTGFNSTMEENLYRINTLRGLGYDPFVQIYDKPNADHELIRLQRWCNNKYIFAKCKNFNEYKG